MGIKEDIKRERKKKTPERCGDNKQTGELRVIHRGRPEEARKPKRKKNHVVDKMQTWGESK